MDDSKRMRLLIEQSKIAKIMRDELWGFTRLSQEETGLPYDIFVDNGETYKEFKHRLWLYADCGRDKVVVTVEENPKIATQSYH